MLDDDAPEPIDRAELRRRFLRQRIWTPSEVASFMHAMTGDKTWTARKVRHKLGAAFHRGPDGRQHFTATRASLRAAYPDTLGEVFAEDDDEGDDPTEC